MNPIKEKCSPNIEEEIELTQFILKESKLIRNKDKTIYHRQD
tara:strand:+ start:362 stop:487 length:126 start_codon:yes stop_codon:yes gene_type:complete